jgi:hypothetical protein
MDPHLPIFGNHLVFVGAFMGDAPSSNMAINAIVWQKYKLDGWSAKACSFSISFWLVNARIAWRF